MDKDSPTDNPTFMITLEHVLLSTGGRLSIRGGFFVLTIGQGLSEGQYSYRTKWELIEAVLSDAFRKLRASYTDRELR